SHVLSKNLHCPNGHRLLRVGGSYVANPLTDDAALNRELPFQLEVAAFQRETLADATVLDDRLPCFQRRAILDLSEGLAVARILAEQRPNHRPACPRWRVPLFPGEARREAEGL